MKDNFGNDVGLLDAVVFASCNQVRFGFVVDVREYVNTRYDWDKEEYKFYSTITVVYFNEGNLVKFSPRNGFVKIPREALPVAFNELLVKNGY